MARPHQKRSLSLLNLPAEILLNIIDHLDQNDPYHLTTVIDLRQTCRHVHDLCEPAFCRRISFGNSQYQGQWDRVLSAREERHNYVESLKIFASLTEYSVGEDSAVATMPQCLSRFPNIRYLAIHASNINLLSGETVISKPFADTLELQLESIIFAKLQKCKLCLRLDSTLKQQPLRFGRLLEAPKLTRLHLENTDLRGFRSTQLPRKSKSLKELSLISCPMDQEGMIAMLACADALRYLRFMACVGAAKFLRIEDRFGSGGELETLLFLLSGLKRHQKDLSELSLSVSPFPLFLPSSNICALDFISINLKTLSFDDTYSRMLIRSSGRTTSWCPINSLTRLPETLEVIKFHTQGGIELDRLGVHLDSVYSSERNPLTSLRFEFDGTSCQANMQRPFRETDQQEETDLFDGLDVIMRRLPGAELKYTPSCFRLAEKNSRKDNLQRCSRR